jgi:acetyl-CoA decarbonylase/synthase complex subunit gamma
MALKALDIFKHTPKTNCKKCGFPTCMAFCMQVSAGKKKIEDCPNMSAEGLAALSDAAAPPMKALTVGAGEAERKIGGETVLFRHEKTFVSKSLYGISLCDDCADKWAAAKAISYERIGEKMQVEVLNLVFKGDAGKYVELVKKYAGEGRLLVLDCTDEAAAKAALDACKDKKPILNGATPANAEAMSKLATDAGVVLGVRGANLDEIYDTIKKLEGLGNKNLVVDCTGKNAKETFANAVELRRAALDPKGGDRSCGYASIVNVGAVAKDDEFLQTALASVFTLKYGSIIIMQDMKYRQALALYGLRQNIFTDPQKPMTQKVDIYPLNKADENAVCAVTVDFALSYFLISGEIERSGVPVNLIVSDAGGYSVLTSWAAGKFSANSITKSFKDLDVDGKIKNHTLLIPGKVAILKGELEENLKGWKIVVAPNEAVNVVKFLKDNNGFKA